MKVPHGTDPADLLPTLPVFLSYVLSFIYLGIYWNNHHHMLHATERVTGGILWANLHLLFWLSLIPFVTAWMGENHFAATPTALYGFVLLMAAGGYWLLQRTIIADQKDQSLLAQAVGRDFKGKLSPLIYAVAILIAFYDERISQALYALVALMWLIPDRRIARTLGSSKRSLLLKALRWRGQLAKSTMSAAWASKRTFRLRFVCLSSIFTEVDAALSGPNPAASDTATMLSSNRLARRLLLANSSLLSAISMARAMVGCGMFLFLIQSCDRPEQ